MKENKKINDIDYWTSFYSKNQVPFKHSLFAQFCLDNYLKPNDYLLELGCGNGRDSVFFAQNNIKVKAVDSCKSEIEFLDKKYKDIKFIADDFCSLDSEKFVYDAIYSRFTIHSISKEQEIMLFPWVFKALKNGGYFCIEVRGMKNSLFGKGEKILEDTFKYEEHLRRFIDFDVLCNELKDVGFNIIYSKEDRGFAPFKDEDDFFIRVICRKWENNEQ